jgi:hypothetical protein
MQLETATDASAEENLMGIVGGKNAGRWSERSGHRFDGTRPMSRTNTAEGLAHLAAPKDAKGANELREAGS